LISLDSNKLLAELRLLREGIEEAILVIERVIQGERSRSRTLAWVEKTTHSGSRASDMTLGQVLTMLRRKRAQLENAMLAIDRQARKQPGAPMRKSSSRRV
jgi:hypothetical protein